MLRDKSPDLALINVHLLDGPTGISVARCAVEETATLALFMTANQNRLPEDFAGTCGVIGKPYTEWGVIAAIRFIDGCMQRGRATGPAPSSIRLAPARAARWKIL